MRENELRKAIANIFSAGEQLNWIVGRLGALDGSGGYDIEVPGRPNHVYVSLGAEGELGQTEAINKGATLNAWRPLKMRRENGKLVIRAADNLDSTIDTVAELLDVTLTSLTDGDALQYDATSAKWINVVPSGGAGGAPSPHTLSGVHHEGLLDWADVNKTGSSLADLAARSHNVLTDIGANDHHNQVHALVGSDHTASGLTTGHVLQATSATAFDFASPLHNITDAFYHSITGSALQVVGATATDTLGLLTPSFAPGAAAALLRTDAAGGIQLDTNLFYVDAPNNRIGINKTPGNAALDVLAYSNADHTLRVQQKSGQTGRLWRVEDTSGDELIVLDSQGNLQSGQPGFVSGLTGWQISPTGTAEFNNVWVRGELHASVFVKDEVHATGGTLLVATAGKLYADATIDVVTVDTEDLEIVSTASGWTGTTLEIVSTASGWTGTTLEVVGAFNYLQIEDPPSGPGFYFADGDVIRSKTEVATGVTDFWFTVKNAHQYDGYSEYSVTKESGTDGTLPAGSAVVSYGQEGDGRILLTSDLNYAPYQDVFTVGPQPWTGAAGAIIPHVRLGRLDGVGVTGTSGIEQYGMIAGSDLSDANSPHLIASNLGLRLFKVDLTLNDGTNDTASLTSDGNLTLGTNIGTVDTTSFSVETTGANAGDVWIGQQFAFGREPNYLHWDQSEGVLHVKGDLLIEGSSYALQTDLDTLSGTVTGLQGTVTGLDSEVDALDGQLGTAITDLQAYADARHVAAVSGVITSNSPTNVTWGPISIRMGDGSTKTAPASSLVLANTRKYLYIDTGAGTTPPLLNTEDVNAFSSGYALIAVLDPPSLALATADARVTILVVGGSTYISGSNIFTGTIVANHIASGSITATKLVVGDDLSLLKPATGSLTINGTLQMNATGKIISPSKAYGNSTAGYFLGYDTVGASAYKFDIGNGTSYLRWDGSSLLLSLNSGINVATTGIGGFLTATRTGHSSSFRLDSSGTVNIDSATANPILAVNYISSIKTTLTGDTFQIQTARTPTGSGTGITGEICWDANYLYVCIGTNVWRRAALSGF